MANEAFVPKEGELYLNRSLLRDPAVLADDWYLRLWSNNYIPGMDSTRVNFTESVWSGYSPHILSPTGWLPPALFNASAISYYTNVPQLFPITSGSATLYGWMITAENATVLWCQRLASPFTVTPTVPFAILPVWAALSFYQPI